MFASKSYSDISSAEFKNLMLEPNTVVIDVRTANEVAEIHISGAITGMDFYNGEFEQKVQFLDKSKTYLVYCRSGVRSASACDYMHSLGFTKLYNLRGGILAWAQ